MMFLRNLVLLTLLAASSAKCTTTVKSLPNRLRQSQTKCITEAAYSKCQKTAGEAWFEQKWYNAAEHMWSVKPLREQAYKVARNALRDSNRATWFRDEAKETMESMYTTDCSTTPAVCLLNKRMQENRDAHRGRSGIRVKVARRENTFDESSEFECFLTIAVQECMLENLGRKNRERMGFGLTKDEATRAVKKVYGRNDVRAECLVGREGAVDYLKNQEEYVVNAIQLYGTSRKTIENSPAKNSQKTTGSSDNTVLIVVVALLSVFALAVGVWVGRLSSEMKIPQDAQLGPVTVETV